MVDRDAGIWLPAFEWRHAIPIRAKASALAKPTDDRVEIGATIEVLRRSIVTIKGREIGYLELADGRGWVPQTNAKSGKDFFVRQASSDEPSASAELAVATASSSSAGGDETVVRTPARSTNRSGASPEMDLAKSERLRAALQTRNKATNDLRRALGDDVPDDGEAQPPPPSAAAATGPPARVWKAVRDPKSGRTYYVHTVTKETTWTAPHPDTMVKKVWKAVLDKRSGRTYYVNQETKEVSWEKPRAHLLLEQRGAKGGGSLATGGSGGSGGSGGPGAASPAHEGGPGPAPAATPAGYGALGPIYALNVARSSSGSGASDALVLDAVMAAIDLEGGVREFYKNWETSNGRSIGARDMLTGLQQAEISVTLTDCQRIVYAFGKQTIGWGQLLRVLNGEVALANEEEIVALDAALDATARLPPPGSLASELDARYHRDDSYAQDDACVGIYDRQPRTAADARPVGGRDHVVMDSASGENAAAREAFNSLSAAGSYRGREEGAALGRVNSPARDRTMLRAIMDGIDDEGGARPFYKRWDTDGDKLLTHRDLYEALQHAGVRISPNDCKRITASVGSDGISMGQVRRRLCCVVLCLGLLLF